MSTRLLVVAFLVSGVLNSGTLLPSWCAAAAFGDNQFGKGEKELKVEAAKLNREAMQLYQQGKPAAAFEKMQQALVLFQELYSASKFPLGHPDLATGLNNVGITLQAMGQLDKALAYLQQSLDMKRALFPAAKFPDGHAEVALGLNNVAGVLELMGQFEKSLSRALESLEMRRQLFPVTKYPEGHRDLAISLNNVGALYQAMGQPETALSYQEQSLVMRRQLFPAAKFPDGHPEIATGLNNLGVTTRILGNTDKALAYYEQCLDMLRRLYPVEKYPNGHPSVATSLNNLGDLHKSMGKLEKALTHYQQALEMRRQLYPSTKFTDGHPHLADSLGSIGNVLEIMGQTEKALAFLQQSLEMRQRFYPAAKYPGGHPQLAAGLGNIAPVLLALGQKEKALSFFEQSLEMKRRLYPTTKYRDGHSDLAESLNGMAIALEALGQAEKAVTFSLQSLEMKQRLYPAARYPDGHPRLAVGLHNAAFLLESSGQTDKALMLFEQCLEMRRRLYRPELYPDGHPEFVTSFSSLGRMHMSLGHTEKALPFLRNALLMQQQLLKKELLSASEAAGFDRIAAEPMYRDAYLSVTRQLKLAGSESYPVIAPSQAMVTRILEQRQANARAAGAAAADKIAKLQGNRRRTEQLLLDTRTVKSYRDQLLTKLADERDKLERELLAEVPTLKRWQLLDQLGPEDLQKALPAGAVFIDLIRYTHFEFRNGKEKRMPSYVAFVVGSAAAAKAPDPSTSVPRIELGEAAGIDAAVHDWRSAIANRRSEAAAATVHDRVWAMLVPHLPAGTTTLFLSADGDLALLPWAALPIGKGRILLERYAVANAPHGTYLLDQWKFPRKSAGAESLLALGGIDYGAGAWPALPGTIREVDAIAALAPGRSETTSKFAATPAAVTALLPKARYAHLATHGEFKADALAAERKRAAAIAKSGNFSDQALPIAAKNPLGYVGLVLSGGEVMSGLALIDLPLENLKLVTLSACETGIGEYTAGEGVQGLQRAFHIAGCPNVVASLWKVNDAATAALMTKFYHELWVNKRPPIEALREAQLTVYRHPELIPDLAGERGAPSLNKAINVRPGEPGVANRRVADTKLWAAFVLSGAGK